MSLQAKEGMDKIKYRALSYRLDIYDELQNIIAMVTNTNQYQRRSMESLNK